MNCTVVTYTQWSDYNRESRSYPVRVFTGHDSEARAIAWIKSRPYNSDDYDYHDSIETDHA